MFFFFWNFIGFHSTTFFQFDTLLSFLDDCPWYPLILSNALSFFLTWLYTLFWWNVSYFLFSSSSSIWLNFFSWWIFIFSHPSQLEWSFMEFHISCVFWWISILSQLDENSCIHFSLSFFLVEVFSNLIAFSFFSQFDAFSKSYLFLMDFLST